MGAAMRNGPKFPAARGLLPQGLCHLEGGPAMKNDPHASPLREVRCPPRGGVFISGRPGDEKGLNACAFSPWNKSGWKHPGAKKGGRRRRLLRRVQGLNPVFSTVSLSLVGPGLRKFKGCWRFYKQKPGPHSPQAVMRAWEKARPGLPPERSRNAWCVARPVRPRRWTLN